MSQFMLLSTFVPQHCMRPWLALHCDTTKYMQKRQEHWLVGRSHTCLSEHGATTSCDCFISPPFCGCSGCLSADTPAKRPAPQLSTAFLAGAGRCRAALSSSASLLASLSVNKEVAGGNPLQQRKLSANSRCNMHNDLENSVRMTQKLTWQQMPLPTNAYCLHSA